MTRLLGTQSIERLYGKASVQRTRDVHGEASFFAGSVGLVLQAVACASEPEGVLVRQGHTAGPSEERQSQVDTSITLSTQTATFAGVTTLPLLRAEQMPPGFNGHEGCSRLSPPLPLHDGPEPQVQGPIERFEGRPTKRVHRMDTPADRRERQEMQVQGDFAPAAASDIVLFGDSTLNATSVSSPKTPLVGEPTAAVTGTFWMQTGNTYAAVSRDSGASWGFLSLTSTFPTSTNTNGGICCDQTVVYIPSHDLFVWQVQYQTNTAKTNNAWRIAVARASELGKPTANIAWTSWELTPAQIGVPGNGFIDRPDVAVGKDFIWYSANVFNINADGSEGSFKKTSVFALSLDQLRDSATSLTVNTAVQDEGNAALAQGSGSTMFWGSRLTSSSIRVRSRSETMGSVSGPTNISHASSPTSTPTCMTPNGFNLCHRFGNFMFAWFSGGKLGFLWNAPQGTGALGTFAYPYVQEAIFDTANLSAPAQNRQISSPTGTYMYPSVGVNARGHRGGSISYMENGGYPEFVLWIDDDLSTMSQSLASFVTSDGATSFNGVNAGWGDYFSSRPHSTASTTWVATDVVQLGGQRMHWAAWFGRERDFVNTKRSRIGVFRPGSLQFYLDYNDSGLFEGPPVDRTLTFGSSGDIPLRGNLIGNGVSRVATFRNNAGTGVWRLDRNGNGTPDTGDLPYPSFGLGTDKPVLGRWTSTDRRARVGTFRPSTACWYFDANGNETWDGGDTSTCLFGSGTDTPIVGDWNGDGVDDIGTFVSVGSNGYFNLDYNGNRVWDGCTIDRCYQFGFATSRPIIGDWNGNGRSKIGVAQANGSGGLDYYLDHDGNGAWTGADRTILNYGLSGDLPLGGAW